MPRQSRRTRAQAAARKRTPVIPRHLLENARPATLEPPQVSASQDVVVEELEAAPEMASAPRIERVPASAPPAAEPHHHYVRAGSPASKDTTPAPARVAMTDYGYVVGELKRIFITALIIIVFLVVVAVLRH